MTNLGHGATAQTSRKEDGSFDVTVNVGSYSTTLQGYASEAQAIETVTTLLPVLINEAAEYFAMQF